MVTAIRCNPTDNVGDSKMINRQQKNRDGRGLINHSFNSALAALY